MRPEFDIVVIGGGAGGLVVAAGGAALGARVALVERDRLGGDCLWHGCVPSKALIASARVAHQMRDAARWAIGGSPPGVDLPRVMERVRDVIRGIEPHDSPERFRGLGVDVVFGAGRFIDRETFEVGGRELRARHFVIATGSKPSIPALPGLDAVRYLTNETLFDLREAVPHLVILGAGPVGCEIAQAFRRLGSAVSLVDNAVGVLPREDRDLAAVLEARLCAEGVALHLGHTVRRVLGDGTTITLEADPAPIAGTHLLVATGRHAVTDGLGLDAAGVVVENGRIRHRDLRTDNRHIWVVGDAAGGAQLTHLAEHHAGIVLRRALFRMGWARPSAVVPACTYTDPELASVGLHESDTVSQGREHQVYRFTVADIDRARTDGEMDGFAKLVTDRKGRLLGAGIVAPHAGELIAECTLAINHGLSIGALSASIHAYPTLSLLVRRAADQRAKEALTPGKRRWLQRIFGLRGAHS